VLQQVEAQIIFILCINLSPAYPMNVIIFVFIVKRLIILCATAHPLLFSFQGISIIILFEWNFIWFLW